MKKIITEQVLNMWQTRSFLPCNTPPDLQHMPFRSILFSLHFLGDSGWFMLSLPSKQRKQAWWYRSTCLVTQLGTAEVSREPAFLTLFPGNQILTICVKESVTFICEVAIWLAFLVCIVTLLLSPERTAMQQIWEAGREPRCHLLEDDCAKAERGGQPEASNSLGVEIHSFFPVNIEASHTEKATPIV